MVGPGENGGVGNDTNAATLQALSRAYASLAPQQGNNGGGGGFPFGVDISSLMGVSSANAVAAVAAAAAKQLGQQQSQQVPANTANLQQQVNTGGLTAQQLSALAAVFAGQHQNNASSPAATTIPANLLSNAAQGNNAPNTPQFNVQALLKSVAAAQGQQMNVGNQHQHHQTQTHNLHNNTGSAAVQPPAPPTSYNLPFQQQQQQTRQQQPQQQQPQQTKPTPAHSQNNSFAPSAQMVASRAVPPTRTNNASSAMHTNQMPHNIQNWPLEQLEQQVKLLQQMKQPVPQSMALLLADARKKEDKKNAKRVANRKSACTSRARKKALVEEMTRTNARLRRQALILSLLPDLVIVISQEGEITFCSAQVERVLRHKVDNLVGASIHDILIPESRAAMAKLVDELVSPSEAKSEPKQNNGPGAGKKADENGNVSAEASSGSGGVSSGAAAMVSNQSFPLEVVNVQSKEEPALDENDNSDTSAGGGKGPVISSLSNSTPMSPSASASLANSGSDPDVGAKGRKKAAEGKERLSPTSKTRLSSSDDSSSGSTETKNIRQANENLERNVRWHNKKLQNLSKSNKAKSHTDDVLGDSVTPNNALARLSSLQHYPETAKLSKKGGNLPDRSSFEDDLMDGVEETAEEKKKDGNNENASDDSGYRESNDSREETSSSESESSNSNGRKKPLAPTCNVCLVRDDLTTLWCEVTSSIRTRRVEDEVPEENSSAHSAKIGPAKAATKQGAESKASRSSTASADEVSQEEPKTHEVKELLLCLRPIRDGDGKVDPSLRFAPGQSSLGKHSSPIPPGSPLEGLAVAATAGELVSESSNGEHNSSCEPNGSSEPNSSTGVFRAVTDGSGSSRKGPPKKRPLQGSAQLGGNASKRSRVKAVPTNTDDTEKSVVESLMLMSNKSN